MANTGFKGISVVQTGGKLIFRASLKDTFGVIVTSGTTTMYIDELQDDGTLKSYDFNDNTFKTTALTTPTGTPIERSRNNGTVHTGIWTYSLGTVSGFTEGAMYVVYFSNSGASPFQQEREFQYGGAEGDLAVADNGVGIAYIAADTRMWRATLLPVPNVSGYPIVDVVKINAVAQTGVDLGADTTTLKTRIPGVVQPQTGDAYARLGATPPTLAQISAAIAALLVTFPVATVTTTHTTTTVTVTGLADTTANAYKDSYALFLTGVNAFAVAFPVLTSTYSGGTTTLTFTGLLAAPSAADTLILLGSLKST